MRRAYFLLDDFFREAAASFFLRSAQYFFMRSAAAFLASGLQCGFLRVAFFLVAAFFTVDFETFFFRPLAPPRLP